MRSNKKGFTLVELITVMVVMGIIMMFAIPSLTKGNINNDKKKVNEYYEILSEGIFQYATSFKNEELGDFMQEGCASFSLDDIYESNIINPFNDTKYECNVKDKIYVKNDHGRYNLEFNFVCEEKESSFLSGRKKTIISKNNVPEAGVTCLPAKKKDKRVLVKTLNRSGERFNNNNPSEKKRYISTSGNGSYIYYASNLWHIFAYDYDDNFLAYNMDTVGTTSFSTLNKEANYEKSDLRNYLESDFLSNLRNQKEYLTLFRNGKTSSGQDRIKKIGLPTASDFNVIASLMNNEENGVKQNFFIMNNTPSIGYINGRNTSIKHFPNTKYEEVAGVLPVVAFSSTDEVLKGNGTLNNPYVLEKNNYWTLPENTEVRELRVGDYLSLSYERQGIKTAKTFRVIENNRTDNLKIASLDVLKPNNPFIENYYSYIDNRGGTSTNYLYPGANTNLYTLTLFYNEENCKNGTVNNGTVAKYNMLNCFTKLNNIKEKSDRKKYASYLNLKPLNQCTALYGEGSYYPLNTRCYKPEEHVKTSMAGSLKLGELYSSMPRNYFRITRPVDISSYWTITPEKLPGDAREIKMWYIDNDSIIKSTKAEGDINDLGSYTPDKKDAYTNVHGTRIVFNLNPELKIEKGGQGTIISPYTVKMNEK